jgi:hypothetical protein
MVFNPNTGDPNTGSGREVFSQNGQVNIIPVAGPISKLLQYLPLPNNGDGIYNNFISSGSQHFDNDQYDGRVDYNPDSATHVFSRYTIADFNNYSPAAFGAVAGGPSAFGFSGDSVDRNQSRASIMGSVPRWRASDSIAIAFASNPSAWGPRLPPTPVCPA